MLFWFRIWIYFIISNSGPVAQRLEQWTHNPLVVGSNPTGPNTQASKNKAVTKTGESSGKSQDGNLAEILFSKTEIEQDLKLVVERWPMLPEHIKAAIKTLIQTHKTEKK